MEMVQKKPIEMNIKQLKKELGISQKDLAEFFDMSYGAFANSTAKERYEIALCRFYSVIKKALEEKIKEKNLTNTEKTIKHESEPLIIHSVSKSLKGISVDAFELWIKEKCKPNSREGYNYKGNIYTKHKLFEIYKNELADL